MAYIDKLRNQGNWLFRWRSFLPLFVVPLFIVSLRYFTYPERNHLLDRLWELFCFSISLLGLAIRIYTVGFVPSGTSGRTTSKPKAKELNTTGMYSVVRHPLYLGNFVIWIGIVLAVHSILLTAFCFSAFYLYYIRIIIAEEAFLSEKFGKNFTLWADKTPTLIPKFKLWRKSTRPFSWQVVLSREYHAFLTITASFLAIEIVSDRFYKGKWQLDWLWLTIFCIGLLTFIVLRTLKKMRIIGHYRNRSAKQPLDV
jgi:protein-S-isoprenylcysteine O-methyltransferase Ste14